MLLKALKIDLPFYSPIFVLGITGLTIATPILPGNIGTFHYACILALTVLGVSKNVDLAYAITFHGIEYIFIVSAGLFFMSIFGLRVGELWELSSKEV